jgi:DNA recombination protein RmuC
MSEEAERLVKALKGDKKAQGTWGEVVLARLLELSGLREGIEYSREKTLKGETAKRYRPDVIVHLPDNKDIVVDAKVSLSAYEQYVAASDDEKVAKKWLDEHVAAIRNHIKRLAEKRYEMLESIATLDFVFIFVPIEPAYLLAVQHDPNLFSFAFEKKIILVSPTTLLSTLRIVENVWRFERQNKNAEEIAKQAGALLDKLAGFVEDLENVGNKLDAARKHWQDAMYKLKDGKSGTVFRRAQKIMELGARSKKSQTFTALPETEQQDVD